MIAPSCAPCANFARIARRMSTMKQAMSQASGEAAAGQHKVRALAPWLRGGPDAVCHARARQRASPPPPHAASSAQHTNKLADEQSPYLLQHAHNPVGHTNAGLRAGGLRAACASSRMRVSATLLALPPHAFAAI